MELPPLPPSFPVIRQREPIKAAKAQPFPASRLISAPWQERT